MSKAAYHLLSPKRDDAHQARVRLVVFGFAGGSITALLPLLRRLPASIEVWGAEYPGRGLRWKDAPIADVRQLLDDLAPGLQALCDRPVALLGYSMGANVAYRLALRLPSDVCGVVAVSATPPCREGSAVHVHAGSDHELLEHLKSLGGIPPEILAHQAIIDAFLPVVRADLSCCAGMGRLAPQQLACPILVLHGAADAIVEPGDGQRWLQVGGAPASLCAHKVYSGGHFFHRGAEDAVAGDVARWITALPGAAPAASNQVLPMREAQLSDNPF